jgi:hypothetical protein
VHVEAVAWIAERKELLASVFWMLSLAAYLSYARRPSWRRYLPLLAAMALGLMSKPTLVTLPAVLLLLDSWPLGRLRSRDDLPRLLLEKLPLAALSLGSSWMTSQAARDAILPVSVLGLESRLANALASYLHYLRMSFWPVDLAAFYPLSPEPARTALTLVTASRCSSWPERRACRRATGAAASPSTSARSR